MKIRPTISVEHFLEKQPLRPYLKSILRANLRWLARFFGSPIYLELPENLQNIDSALFEAVKTAAELKTLGIIKSIRKKPKSPDGPFVHIYYTDLAKDCCWGQSFLNEEQALWSCIAEATERYLWSGSTHFFEKNLVKSSYGKIKEKALNIFSLAGFSEDQKEQSECLAKSSDDIFRWTVARSLTQNRNIFCPIQLVSSNYFHQNVQTPHKPEKREKMLRWCVSTGLATGRSLEEALVKGILEIIERDAFMITYLNELSPPRVDLENIAEQDKDLEKILKSFRRYNLEVNLLKLPTDFPVNTYLCTLVDRTGVGPALTLGARAGFDPKQDILDSLAESFDDLFLARSIPQKKPDPAKPLGRRGRVSHWSDPEQLAKIEFLHKGETTRIDLLKTKSFYQSPKEDISRRKYYRKKLDLLVNSLKKKNYEACYVEITAPEVKKLGLRCVNVVIPELQPMHLMESLPYFGGKRLKEIPMKLGYKPAEELNQEPHPFP